MPDVVLKKLTPVLIVEAIEPCLPLWTDRLGFTRVAEVPHGETLGFVMLSRDGIEIMYQTIASVEQDLGEGMAREGGSRASAALFIEVSDLDEIVARLDGFPIVLSRRRTFYGMDEVGIAEPGGHTIVFAQPAPDA